MERRQAIKNIGLSFGAVVATPSMLSLLKSCGPTEEPWVPVFFTEEEGIVVRKLVNAFLPAVDNYPSATDVNVHIFVDKYIHEVMEFDDRKNNRDSLGIVIKQLLQTAGKETVPSLEMDDYVPFLDANLKKTKEEEGSIFEQMGKHMAENNNDPTGLSDEVRIYTFLNGLRDLSIWAYKTNERVGETVLAYKPIPGEQQGCVGLQETTGGLAWSLS